jgi:hypothetical protein
VIDCTIGEIVWFITVDTCTGRQVNIQISLMALTRPSTVGWENTDSTPLFRGRWEGKLS